MKAWDIFNWQPPGWPEPHPAVIVSHPDRVANKPDVTVILCASRTAARKPEPNEVILDANDGLDWPTLCKCDLLYTLQKAQLGHRRGTVSAERRRQIIATINRANGWL
jgi:mRNA-degrading endonuclease toxin of MazEF toxin-antitoxin module